MNPESESDEEIAVRVQSGDAEAFGVLMERYEAKLLRYGRKFLGDSAAIEDATQEVFIRAYEHLQGFDARQRFSPWIYRIAHNIFVNMLRSKSRSRVFAVDLDTFAPHAAYEDPAEREREQEMMRKAIETGLDRIAPNYREVLVLYYLEEFSYKEIADVLHVPIGTVGIRLTRARQALKQHLDPTLLS